jgi:hypothetical protein
MYIFLPSRSINKRKENEAVQYTPVRNEKAQSISYLYGKSKNRNSNCFLNYTGKPLINIRTTEEVR